MEIKSAACLDYQSNMLSLFFNFLAVHNEQVILQVIVLHRAVSTVSSLQDFKPELWRLKTNGPDLK